MRDRLFESKSNESAINEVQKYYLCEWISAIYHNEFDEKGINPRDIVDAFQAMLQAEVSITDKQKFIAKGLWNGIQKVREIFLHPRPQEKLDLIKYNDKAVPAIGKEAVVNHLRELIEEKISMISARQLKQGS